MTTTFPLSTPSALGIAAGGVTAFLDALDAAPDVEPHSLLLLRHGRVAAQGWWAPYEPERVHLLYSLSKSFTAAAVGLAVEEGLIDLDAPVVSYFPEFEADITDERSRRILVRHVLAMASGHADETIERAQALDPENLVRGFLLLRPDEEPGTVFAYNQPCTYSLGAIVRKVTGGSLLDYLRPRLLDPLGIEQAAWVTDASGGELGYSGLHATTESIAKLGQLYLQRGVWEGERILTEAWVEEATRKHIDNPQWENPDWQQGYGFQFWMARHGFRGDGAYGQFCVVLPEHDVVLAITSQSIDMQAVLDAAWEHLLPAIDAPTDADADDALARRLASAALSPVEGEPLGDLDAQTFAKASGAPVGFATFREVRVERGSGDAPATLVLVDGDDVLEAEIGAGAWSVTGPLAVSAARAGTSVAIDVAFIETPHRLHLLLDPAASTFEPRWETEPLHATLHDLRKP
ncbi:6-aminohexanoate-dimer hydrolase [Frondihabitans sp. 762G35]|uniref:serine hydrolase domain-containing protein n=1 Tax=Frondihabitans sp. 762G35 TaxID=1446794 RepID=UPI000D22BA55|nr:serine hydrolase [Frondihabitans sp. 762G35]ARC58478.1 6-aminohexanoate-dimer hydrolase [Frondihabitans sp. 762G35]